MSDVVTPLAAGFPARTRADWMALVLKTLKGESADALVWSTYDGVDVRALYTADDGVEPVCVGRRLINVERPWDLRCAIDHPDLARANAEALADLEGGAASILLTLDPSAERGVAVASAEDLARVLDGVLLDVAPVALDAGFMGPPAADWLAQAAKGGPQAALAFHFDPLSAFAESGASPGPVAAHAALAAETGARHVAAHPHASLFLASGRAVHEAGGTKAQELGFAAACALTYARALTAAGLPLDQAFARVMLGLSLEGEYFTSIAKLRAARLIWARLTSACGVHVPARIEGRSSRRMLAAQDPWVNLLRLTAAGFAGAVGGADAVILDPFTQPLGQASAFARRQARNTQLVLMEEAHLGKVQDPARGSWFLDQLSEDLARAGWAFFQEIERRGGAAAALIDGFVAAQVAEVCARREQDLASGANAMIGVTKFPPLDDRPAPVEAVDRAAFAKPAPDVRPPGPDDRCPPLAPVRLARPHEQLRSAPDGR